jgi:hypothetical protein
VGVGDLARLELRGAGRAVLAFRQDEPAAREGLVDFRVIAFLVVMAAGQVVLGAHLAGVDDGGPKEDVALGLAVVKGIILLANGVVFFPNAPFQDVRVQVEPAEGRRGAFGSGPLRRESRRCRPQTNAAGERGVQDFHYIVIQLRISALRINISNSARPPASLLLQGRANGTFTGVARKLRIFKGDALTSDFICLSNTGSLTKRKSRMFRAFGRRQPVGRALE